ncbi:MAG: hypothetical protein E6261_03995 [Cutibacterium avidum]|nr:hypothetical protein [Cutibacterium avidum]
MSASTLNRPTRSKTPSTFFPDEDRAEILKTYGPAITRIQAGKITGTSERTIGRLIDAGQLKLYKVGCARALRLKTTDVLDVLEQVA